MWQAVGGAGGKKFACAGIVLGALLVTGSAAADLTPVYRKGQPVYVEACPESQRAGLECLTATRGELGLPPNVAEQLHALGFTKRCEESHNDRYMGYWCRRPDAQHPVPDGLPESLRGGVADQVAARMRQDAEEQLARDAGASTDGGKSDGGDRGDGGDDGGTPRGAKDSERRGGCGSCAIGSSRASPGGPLASSLVLLSLVALRRAGGRRSRRG